MQQVSDEVHKQRQELILQIAKHYTSDSGQIKLTEAFAAQPLYRTQLAGFGLDSSRRLNAYVLHMRRKGLLPKTKGNGRSDGASNRIIRSQSDYSLVHHIEKLRKSQKIGWAQFFKDHPEWGQRLGYPEKKAMSFIYRVLRSPDPKVPFDGDLPGPGAPVQPVVAVQPADASQPAVKCPLCKFVSQEGPNRWAHMTQHLLDKHVQVPEPPLPFNFCPKCGSNLLMFVTAFKVASKHSQNGGHE